MSRMSGSKYAGLVQHRAVLVAERPLPHLLLARKHELFKLAMSRDQHRRGRRFKRHAALDSQNRVAHVHAASDAVATGAID